MEDLRSKKVEAAEQLKMYSRLLDEYLSLRDTLVSKQRKLKLLKSSIKFRHRLVESLKQFLREEMTVDAEEKKEDEEAEEGSEF